MSISEQNTEAFFDELSNFSYMLDGATNLWNTITLIISTLLVVAWWMTFQKGGQPGWKILIPFYCTYIKCKLAGKKGYSIPLIITQILLPILGITEGVIMFEMMFAWMGSADLYESFMKIFLVVFVLIAITVLVRAIFKLLLSINISKVYGVNIGFGIGIFFLEFIFIPILGLNKNIKYVGPANGFQ